MPIGLRQTVAPVAEPVLLAEAKQHLRVDGAYDDALITRLIGTAREYAERETRRQLLTATYRLTLDYFPGRAWTLTNEALPREKAWEYGRYFHDRAILLPRPPLQSVTSVVYLDANGQQQTLDPTQYVVDAENEPGRIAPAYGVTWPTTREQVNAVQVTYVAGYASSSLVPKSIGLAMLLLIRTWYDRPESLADKELFVAPMAVQSLLGHETVPWLF